MTEPSQATRGRTFALLALTGVPVLAYLGVMAFGTVDDARQDERWNELQAEATVAYGHRTAPEVMAASSAWTFAGTWTLPVPDGLAVIGAESGPDEAEIVFASTGLASERCLQLLFDEQGMTTDRATSCQAYRATGGGAE